MGAYLAGRRRGTPGNMPAMYLTLSAAGWTLFYALELFFNDLQSKLVFSSLKFIFIVWLPVILSVMMIRFAGWSTWPSWKVLIVISIVPALNLLAVLTNPLHHMYWKSITLTVHDGYTTLTAAPGLFYWPSTIYAYLLIIVSASISVAGMHTYWRSFEKQVYLLLGGILLPLSLNVSYVAGWQPLAGVNFTPISLGISVLVLAGGLKFDNVFDVVSLAHNTIISQLRDGLIVVDNSNRIIEVNRVMENVIGLRRADLAGRHAAEIDHPVTRFFGSGGGATLLREIKVELGGVQHWYEVRVSNVYAANNNVAGRMAILHEITDRKRMEHDLRYESTHDALTGLFNRKYFEDQLALVARGSHWPVAFMLIDMDNLKSTNDAYGHDAGDELLKRLAGQLRITLRQDDIIARIGGDEFGVLVTRFKDENNIQQLIERMRSNLTRPIGEHRLKLEFSIGYAIAHSSQELEEARILADQRMYADKQNRKKTSNHG